MSPEGPNIAKPIGVGGPPAAGANADKFKVFQLPPLRQGHTPNPKVMKRNADLHDQDKNGRSSRMK